MIKLASNRLCRRYSAYWIIEFDGMGVRPASIAPS
jgi:hypothetical protein